MKINQLLIAITLLVAGPCFAAWTLDNDASQVSFVSVKAGDAGEVHRFTEISGPRGPLRSGKKVADARL